MTSTAPRYAPRTSYRARPSSRELTAADDLAATALDRPIVDLSGLVPTGVGVSSAVAPSPLAWAPFVVTAAITAGVCVGALLAWVA